MPRWETAVEEQVALLHFWGSKHGAEYAHGFAQDVRDKGRQGVALYEATHIIETAKLQRAEPVWVDANILDLVDYARQSFQPEVMLPTDLFTSEGFAFFERPVFVEDVNGKQACFRAMSWGPVDIVDRPSEHVPDQQLHICLYSHLDDDDDYSTGMREKFVAAAKARGMSARDMHRLVWGSTRLSMFHVGMVPFGMTPEDVYSELTPEQQNLPSARGLLALEQDDKGGMVEADDSWRNTWAFIQVFFRLAQQRIATVTSETGDRHARKRIARMKGKPAHIGGVQVVTLRRPKRPVGEDHVAHSVDWKHRWVVEGHWRNQFYPSTKTHRQIWIAPYVKGPEDADLVLPAGKVFEFTR